MDGQQVNAFYEEHKMKKGKDYRLEVLKFSKEDIYDYLDYRHSDNIHGWRTLLQEEQIKNKRLTEEIEKLKQDKTTNHLKL